ncbi:hypothetical protein CONPUDRAFT_167271 [Coniophora puteana RWD-64-598 SS2]|uniref:DASH complex subunit DAM1 n=1 Tax=Coniophora puteana (strain RWD-64-598) TaxID=741705 RepID=A0A5M3MHV4_CONPW|nr:uncharacterized protein CONPUDRAFT_167271 [Coniophora puteana RWD-64-598 SS2]EIW78211.1 hypothetical protein CONPUDRAFT_167271 [Coniophora puteana RWD-64-598 SS2]
MATPHRTPLRRISQGSLRALSRSQTRAEGDAPHGLGFMEPALSELLDETEALHANAARLSDLSNALRTFNDGFASWLYVMDMNALTVDWPQAPNELSYMLSQRRAEEEARAQTTAPEPEPSQPDPTHDTDDDRTTYTDAPDGDMSYATTATGITSTSASKFGTAPAKKKGKPKMSAKEKKERSLAIEKTISNLPLEFRGNDPNLRRNMETVIEKMMDRAGAGVKLLELITPPDLNQARVNKCLIALVNRKIVRKDNSTGTVLYHWIGLA